MDSVIEEIKQRIDIVELISSYLKLEKTGANYRAVCPFHSEKKPSFFVSPARQIWKCFGCSAHGDVFGFVMQIEGLEFGDALKILAQKAGVQLVKQDPRLNTERKKLYDICELTTKFFEKQLQSSQTGGKILEYLKSRGITKESIKEWRIGYSPESWHGLMEFLIKSGFTNQEIEKSGVTVRNENGKVYDRFRGRIMFPIFDLNSQPVGFGARIFGTQDKTSAAKYINITNTPIYDKSRILYGLDKAKVEIRKADSFILVEGYTDAILSHQAGVKNVVAVSGTALTPFHLGILKRYAQNLISGFDMDVAGDSATKRGIDLAQKEGFNIKVLALPQDMDPADAIAKNPDIWEQAIKNSKSIMDFYFESALNKFDKTKPDGKREISKALIPAIKRISNKIEAAHWTQQLAKELNVPLRAVEEEMAKYKGDKIEEKPEDSCIVKIASRQEKIEERIMCLILKWPEFLKDLTEQSIKFLSEINQKIIKVLASEKPEHWEKMDLPEDLNEYFNLLFLQSRADEHLIGQELKEAKEEFLGSVKDFYNLAVKSELDHIGKKIKQAETDRNDPEMKKLMQEFNKLSQQLMENN